MEANIFPDPDDITRFPEVPAVLSYSSIYRINKKAPVRRLFEPEAFHLQISSINLEETFVLLYIRHVFQYDQPLHQQQVNLGR